MKCLKWFLGASLVSVAILSLCGFESAPSLPFIPSTYSGHEEITRQALNNTIRRLQGIDRSGLFLTQDFSADLGPTPKGLFGSKSQNMLVHGNFATDFPAQTQILDLSRFWNISSFGYSDNPRTQVFHFLRNYKDSVTVESARETCYQARENIKFATQEALKFWAAGDHTKALFLLGHVTHTIQDSFSAAHARREGASNNYNIRDICFYGEKMGQAINDPSGRNQPTCYHGATDGADVIWSVNSEQQQLTQAEWPNEKSIQCNKSTSYPDTEEQKQSCLKHEARLARLATEKYLYLVLAHLNAPTQKSLPDFIASLDTRLFEGPVGNAELDSKMAAGIMRCENLSDAVIHGEEPLVGTKL